MPKTFVLITLYQGDTNILAAGDDLERMRRALRAEARRVVSTGEYDTPSRKELKAEILAALKKPDIMSWDDGEIEDLYSVEIKEIPLWNIEAINPRTNWEKKIINFLKKKFKSSCPEEDLNEYDDEAVFYEDSEISCEGINPELPGAKEEVACVYVRRNNVFVSLITYGKSGDGHDDTERFVNLTALPPKAQKIIHDTIIKTYDEAFFQL